MQLLPGNAETMRPADTSIWRLASCISGGGSLQYQRRMTPVGRSFTRHTYLKNVTVPRYPSQHTKIFAAPSTLIITFP